MVFWICLFVPLVPQEAPCPRALNHYLQLLFISLDVLIELVYLLVKPLALKDKDYLQNEVIAGGGIPKRLIVGRSLRRPYRLIDVKV